MNLEASKLLVRRYIEEVVNMGDVDALPRFISTDYVEVYNNVRHATGSRGQPGGDPTRD